MVKKILVGSFKVCFFIVTFIAYWFCLDEKYYHDVDRKIAEKWYKD